MNCDSIKISDFINVRAKDETECGKEVQAMKTVLSFAMPYIYSLPGFRVREEIDISGNADTLEYPIYKVLGFFGKKSCGCTGGKTCSSCHNCFTEMSSCNFCDEGLVRIKMNNTYGIGEVTTGNYYLTCPNGTDIVYKLPNGLSKAYVWYVRDVSYFSDVNATIDIPAYLYGAIALLIKYFTRKDGTEIRRKSDFEAHIQQLQYIYSPDIPTDLQFVSKDVPNKFNSTIASTGTIW